MTTLAQNQQIIDYLLPYQPTKIGIFGSAARGQQKTDSDLDILVNLSASIDLFKFMEIWDNLEDLLAIKIDLVTENALKTSNKRVQNSIANDLILIYEK